MSDKDELFSDDELAAMEDARQTQQERREQQQAFLDSVSDESDTEILETSCELTQDHTVTVKAKLQGEVLDKLGHIQERLENVQNTERLYEIGEAADDASQLLSDIIVESAYDKDTFYQVYESEGLEELGKLLRRCFDSLQEEQERRRGTADGFRQGA